MHTRVELGMAVMVVHLWLVILPAHSRNPLQPNPGAEVVASAQLSQSLLQTAASSMDLYASLLYATSFCSRHDCLAHCLDQVVSTWVESALSVPLEITSCAGMGQAMTSGV